jgi:predicted metal-dependent hydrolase
MTTPTPQIALAGQAVHALPEAGALHIDTPTGYVTRLALAAVALLIVDADDPAWRYWTTTPKSSPATRRIPVLVLADTPDQRAEALLAGADLTLPHAELSAALPGLLRDFARVLDAETQAQLTCECDAALPELARQGIERFNAGDYYAQHDLFEALWVATPTPVRDLYRAILQVGIAYYQVERGNRRGALKMLLRSVQWLSILPDECQGVDVAALRADSYRVRAALEALTDNQLDRFDRTLLQPVKWRR